MRQVKNRSVWAFLFFFGLTCSLTGFLWEEEPPQEGSVESAAPVAPAKPKVPAVNQAQMDRKKAMQALNGTEWNLYLKPRSGGSARMEDTLRFKGGRLTSERLSADGYPTTNLTFNIRDDGVAIWETMQTSEDSGLVFWKGELHGERMKGILSEHPAEGSIRNWVFSGELKKTLPPPPPPPVKGEGEESSSSTQERNPPEAQQ